jgi:hypothetical protein
VHRNGLTSRLHSLAKTGGGSGTRGVEGLGQGDGDGGRGERGLVVSSRGSRGGRGGRGRRKWRVGLSDVKRVAGVRGREFVLVRNEEVEGGDGSNSVDGGVRGAERAAGMKKRSLGGAGHTMRIVESLPDSGRVVENGRIVESLRPLAEFGDQQTSYASEGEVEGERYGWTGIDGKMNDVMGGAVDNVPLFSDSDEDESAAAKNRSTANLFQSEYVGDEEDVQSIEKKFALMESLQTQNGNTGQISQSLSLQQPTSLPPQKQDESTSSNDVIVIEDDDDDDMDNIQLKIATMESQQLANDHHLGQFQFMGTNVSEPSSLSSSSSSIHPGLIILDDEETQQLPITNQLETDTLPPNSISLAPSCELRALRPIYEKLSQPSTSFNNLSNMVQRWRDSVPDIVEEYMHFLPGGIMMTDSEFDNNSLAETLENLRNERAKLLKRFDKLPEGDGDQIWKMKLVILFLDKVLEICTKSMKLSESSIFNGDSMDFLEDGKDFFYATIKILF